MRLFLLSKSFVQLAELQGQLFWHPCRYRWWLEGIVQPNPQIAVDEQLLRNKATKFDSDQPKVARSCRYLISSMAISAVQILDFQGVRGGPHEGLHFRFCLSALKNNSTCTVACTAPRLVAADHTGCWSRTPNIPLCSSFVNSMRGKKIPTSCSASLKKKITSSRSTPRRLGVHGFSQTIKSAFSFMRVTK